MRCRLLILLVVLLLALPACASETIPPSPTRHYIVDEAHVLSPGTRQSIDQQRAAVGDSGGVAGTGGGGALGGADGDFGSTAGVSGDAGCVA